MATGLINSGHDPYRGVNVKDFVHSIAHSGMFGCENEHQAFVLAMTCIAKRCDPLSLAEKYHLIQGDLSMRSDAMLAGLHERGGKSKVISRTGDAAEIEIAYDGDTQRFRLTWEEAQQEDFTKDKKGNVKKNYSTPRSRMQMLWARVVSDGVRTMCPEVVAGSYTPEEISDYRNLPMNAATDNSSAQGKVEVVPGDVVDVQAEPVKPETNGACTTEQSVRIRDLFDQLNVPAEKREAALAKRGAATIRNLTHEAAAEFIKSLEEKAAKLAASAEVNQVAGESRADPTAVVATNNDPCTEVQVNKAKSIIKELAQVLGPDIAKRVKAKLESHQLKQISDLTVSECDLLIDALNKKNLEAWAEEALAGWSQLKGVPF